MIVISTYNNESHSKNGGIEEIEDIFEKIRNGTWKNEVDEIRFLKNNFKIEEERVLKNGLDKKQDEKYLKAKSILTEKKGKINRITVSGKFSPDGRSEKNLIQHSGLIDIDIDGIPDVKEVKAKLINDKYCFACFISCGGDGLSFIARIDPQKISQSWEGFQKYFRDNYGLSIDAVHKNVANTRNVSYDPALFYIPDRKVPVFREYIKQKKKPKIIQNFVHSNDDFYELVKEISVRRIDFCPEYEDYFTIGAAIASKYGIEGFQYFDAICQWSIKYNPKSIEKDYNYWVKHPDRGITIATFYAKCKEFGLEINSKKTSRIASAASAALKIGTDRKEVIKNLAKFENLKPEECEDIVNQVYDNKIDYSDENSILDEIENFILHNYSLLKNSLTGKLENNEIEWTEEDLNGMYVTVKKAFPKADAKWIERIVFSPFIKSYNPILKFFKENQDKLPDELLEKGEIPNVIKKLWKSIKTDDYNYLEKFGTKWLTSIVAAAHGDVSNLDLEFTGELNKGKTYFFSHLLPQSLQKYFAESTLDKDKDDEILMCHKLLILINESAGKTRADEKRYKRLLDKDVFSIRRPYRKDNEDIKRLAVLGGTSNPQNLLTDTHGNRRIIPINVLSRDFKAYDEIDKDELLMAAYYLWKSGFEWRIVEEEIPELNQATLMFNDYSLEYELITKYFEEGNDKITSSDVKIYLEKETGQRLSLSKITNELRRLRFEKDVDNKYGKITYKMKFKNSNEPPPFYDTTPKKDYF